MKSYLKKAIALMLCIATIACSKDDSPGQSGDNDELNETQGISEDDLERYLGSLGISISARNIAKKGYIPETAEITVNATTGDYNATVDIDVDTNIAQLSFDVEDLSEEARDELSSGVPISITIKDGNGSVLSQEDISIVSFKNNPPNEEINSENLVNLYNESFTFRESQKYYMQIVAEGDLTSDNACWVDYNGSGTYGREVNVDDQTGWGTEDWDFKYQYTFLEIPNSDGAFAIVTGIVTSAGENLFLEMTPSGYLFQDNGRHVDGTNLATIPNSNRFRIIKDDNGLHRMYCETNPGAPLRIVDAVDGKRISNNNTDDDIAYFRILSLNIDWDIEVLETRNLQPILPAAANAASFENNSKLTNCTNGPLSQTFIVDISESKTSQAGFEESFSMTSTETVGGSLTLGVEAEASFFGTGATVSAEATASYEQQTAITNVNTQYSSEENGVEQTYSSTRTIEVPPGDAVLVYDTFQVYNNIQIPFVQRYRIRGQFIDGNGDLTLSGEEIMTQFSFTNANNGVITEVEIDYIEFTVRGVNTVKNVIRTTSKAESTEPNCN
ncbi:hypothetical protein FBALC1_06478 [Flavobacteriales bacterium ALC-1]|nr:hypothetical protein FBALC1_06478 [Flavobacteriales bacterium ALC-1]